MYVEGHAADADRFLLKNVVSSMFDSYTFDIVSCGFLSQGDGYIAGGMRTAYPSLPSLACLLRCRP